MDICNMVRFFSTTDLEKLENTINNWFSDNPVLLVDIKFNQFIYNNICYYTAMIIYQ